MNNRMAANLLAVSALIANVTFSVWGMETRRENAASSE
jgi:hypothetical protein